MLMDLIVVKMPEYNDDDYLIKYPGFVIEQYDRYIDLDPYTSLKSKQFANFDMDPQIWLESPFLDRPALRNLNESSDMSGSIYTATCGLRNIDTIYYYNHINFKAHYENCIDMVKRMLEYKSNSRRIFMRMANSLQQYAESELTKSVIDTTCLIGIHYMKDSFKLIFRASDVQNEIIPDILTIYKYFIVPVYDVRPLDLTIYASTAQNVGYFYKFIDNFQKMVKGIAF
jgi:hypothetical protein